MGEMKIDLLPKAIPIKKIPHKLAHKYKEIVKTKIDNMLLAGIIYLVDQSECASPMVVQPKKHDPNKLRVYVNYRWLNKAIKTNPDHLPNKVPNEDPDPVLDKVSNQISDEDWNNHHQSEPFIWQTYTGRENHIDFDFFRQS